jgi:hypothetical protein
MARKWEEFDEPATGRIAVLHVSLSPKGQVFLSRRAHEALDSPSHVVMLWEDKTSTIGIRSVPPRTKNAFQLYPTNISESYRFHTLRFIKKHDIQLDYTFRFPTAFVEDGVLLLELQYRVRSHHGVQPKNKRP